MNLIEDKKDSTNKERNSSFELLRIICMLLIIIHHYAGFVGPGSDLTLDSMN